MAVGLHNREVKLPGNSAEVLPGQSTESLPTKSTEMLNKVELKRELGLFSAVNLNVGCMIGKQHRSEAPTAVAMKTTFFWFVMPRSWRASPTVRRNMSPYPAACFLLGLIFDPDYGEDLFLQNVGISPNYVELYNLEGHAVYGFSCPAP